MKNSETSRRMSEVLSQTLDFKLPCLLDFHSLSCHALNSYSHLQHELSVSCHGFTETV